MEAEDEKSGRERVERRERAEAEARQGYELWCSILVPRVYTVAHGRDAEKAARCVGEEAWNREDQAGVSTENQWRW